MCDKFALINSLALPAAAGYHAMSAYCALIRAK
jgi:hypothetical protein